MFDDAFWCRSYRCILYQNAFRKNLQFKKKKIIISRSTSVFGKREWLNDEQFFHTFIGFATVFCFCFCFFFSNLLIWNPLSTRGWPLVYVRCVFLLIALWSRPDGLWVLQNLKQNGSTPMTFLLYCADAWELKHLLISSRLMLPL